MNIGHKNSSLLSVAVLACMVLVATSIAKPLYGQNKKFTVILDAGHGGKDGGTVGTKRYKMTEKDIALDVTLTLGRLIERKMRNVKVIYTRKRDNFVELWRRSEIARESNADLFISVHCNFSPSKKSIGAETYVMGVARNNENLALAKRENEVAKLEDDFANRYNEADLNSPESLIGLVSMQSNFMEQSLLFSRLVQDKFKIKAKRSPRRVKQAGFWVLRMTFMPSVLIELGFLSNKKEEDFLMRKKGRNTMAKAIYDAFKEYVDEIERRNENSLSEGVYIPELYDENADDALTTESKPHTSTSTYFTVQVLVSKNRQPPSSSKLRGLRSTNVFQEKGLYKYTYGKSNSYAEILKTLEYVKGKGFVDAFVIAFRNKKKISVNEAIKYLGRD